MHINATIKMQAGVDCWDKVSLIIKDDDVFSLIRFRDRYSCLDLYRRLSICHFEGFEKSVSVTIDGQDYRWRDEVWRAVLNVTDIWFEEYMQLVELKEPTSPRIESRGHFEPIPRRPQVTGPRGADPDPRPVR